VPGRRQCPWVVLGDDRVQSLHEVQALERDVPVVVLEDLDRDVLILGHLGPTVSASGALRKHGARSRSMVCLGLAVHDVKDPQQVVQVVSGPAAVTAEVGHHDALAELLRLVCLVPPR